MEKLCPLMDGPCIEHRCKWFIKLLGNNPQTGAALKEEEDCVISFLPILLIESTQQTRQAGAAIESFRNEVTLGLASVATGTQRLNHLIEEARQFSRASLSGH